MALAPFFRIAGFVTTLDALVPGIDRHQPDLVVLDLMFEGGSSLPVMRAQIHDRRHACRFLVLTAHDSETFRTEAITSGAAGFLSKGVNIQGLRLAIEAALASREIVSLPRVLRAGRGHRNRPSSNKGTFVGGVCLRRRQAEAILLLHDGLTRQAIADRLGITVRGVDYHLGLAKEAVGTASLLLLARWAGEHAVELALIRDEGADSERLSHPPTRAIP